MSNFGGFQEVFLNFMPKRDAEIITEATPMIDLSSLKKPKVFWQFIKTLFFLFSDLLSIDSFIG